MTVVVLLGIVPYIAFRVYVNLSVARHVESYINGTSSHDNPLAAYPEETFDYVIRTLDPENSERCRLSQHLLASLFYHGCHLDSDIVKQHESLVRHCMTLTVERFDENDSPEETRRKCRELREWWDRY